MSFDTEKLFIRVYNKDLFMEYLDNQLGLQGTVVASVFLPVNPYNVTFSKPRSVTFHQTLQPRRFIILDWGQDIQSITVRGQTGRLLSENIIYKEENTGRVIKYGEQELKEINYEKLISLPLRTPQKNLINEILNAKTVDDVAVFLSALPITENDIFQYSAYRYLMLKVLEKIYQNFDANEQLMSLSWMGNEYWGIITDFSYSWDTGSLWNIKYEFTFKYLPTLNFLEDWEYNKKLVEGAK